VAQSAYIKFVEGSTVASMTLDDVKQQLADYQEQARKTAQQLSWAYDESTFPYSIETKEDGYFYLKGTNAGYFCILFGVGEAHVQVVLPDGATHGDKGKANELCKFIATRNKAELHLFNGRTMYFNPRK
jgi:hypothetical protein